MPSTTFEEIDEIIPEKGIIRYINTYYDDIKEVKLYEKYGGDMYSLLLEEQVSLRFVELYYHKIHWSMFTATQKCNIELFERYSHKIVWRTLAVSHIFESDDIEFLEYFEDKINWMMLSVNRYKIPDEILIHFAERLNWWPICMDQELSEDVMVACEEHLDWIRVSKHQKFSKEFYEKYKHKIYELGFMLNDNLDWKV